MFGCRGISGCGGFLSITCIINYKFNQKSQAETEEELVRSLGLVTDLQLPVQSH